MLKCLQVGKLFWYGFLAFLVYIPFKNVIRKFPKLRLERCNHLTYPKLIGLRKGYLLCAAIKYNCWTIIDGVNSKLQYFLLCTVIVSTIFRVLYSNGENNSLCTVVVSTVFCVQQLWVHSLVFSNSEHNFTRTEKVCTKEYLWIKNCQRLPSSLLNLSFAL